jgi:hypothetical protein
MKPLHLPLIAMIAIYGNDLVGAEVTLAEQRSQTCSMIYSLAEAVMEKRQSEVPMPDLIAIMQPGDEIDGGYGTAMVMAAYKIPVYPAGETKKIAKEFAEAWYSTCLETAIKLQAKDPTKLP